MILKVSNSYIWFIRKDFIRIIYFSHNIYRLKKKYNVIFFYIVQQINNKKKKIYIYTYNII